MMPNRVRYGLARGQRLVASYLVREAFDQGRSHAGRLVVVWERSGPGASARLGVVTGARTFRKAVYRSRARRLMREAFRLNRSKLRSDIDYVLIGRRGLMDCTCADLEKDLLNVARAKGLMSSAREKGDQS